MHIYMLLIVSLSIHFQPPVFPDYRLPDYRLPDTNSPIWDKVYYVQSGTWVYLGLGSIGGFVIGEKVIGDLGLSGSWD